MKKIIAMILVLVVCIGGCAFAEVDLSGMTYEELVSLKDQINLAIWNSKEWQEVVVPIGVWEVGKDIPAGHWTVKAAYSTASVQINWGDYLDDSGQNIRWKGTYELYNTVYGKEYWGYDEGDPTEYSFEVKNGQYIVIENSSALFTPYSGKPDLGFKW